MSNIERIKQLVTELNRHSYNYYVLDKPTISDKQYDVLYDELLQLEKETNYILSNSPTQKVQGQVLPYLTKVKHTEPMLSADKSKDINDIKRFMGVQPCILSWKLDGLTIVLRYNHGKLQQAITRGGGEEGEDVTHTVKTFTNIPLAIEYKGYLEIRGEGLVTFAEFERINQELIAKGEETYSSPRNLAAGSVRQLDSNITKQRNLIFIAFGIVKCDNMIWTKDKQLDWLKELGFESVEHEMVNNKNIDNVVSRFKDKLLTLPYLTDGLIIEYWDIAYGNAQGVTGHHSKNMMALKHEDDSFETVFRGVELNTTRTGMVSITALFDSVDMEGVSVSRASLHNYDIFEEFELGVGDMITVYRANQVIPQLEDNLTRSNTYKLDMKCPSCGSDIVIKRPKEARFLFCENDNCPAKLISKFTHFVSKNCMNIEGLSESTLEKFINKGFLKTFSDIYDLEKYKTEIISMEGFGKRSYDKLIESINKSKKVKLESFIAALGIPQIGKTASKTIAKYFNNDWFAFENALIDGFDFTKLDDFGTVMNDSLLRWYRNPNEYDMWVKLTYILNFEKEEKKEVIAEDNPFKGMSVYPTGKFQLKKDELKIKLEELGAIVENGYKKSLDMLIAGGDTSKSGKVDKAVKDGVKIVTEEFLMQYIE